MLSDSRRYLRIEHGCRAESVGGSVALSDVERQRFHVVSFGVRQRHVRLLSSTERLDSDPRLGHAHLPGQTKQPSHPRPARHVSISSTFKSSILLRPVHQS